MHDIAQKQIFLKNYQSWIRIRIWWWNIRIWQKGPDPTGSGSATLPTRTDTYWMHCEVNRGLYVYRSKNHFSLCPWYITSPFFIPFQPSHLLPTWKLSLVRQSHELKVTGTVFGVLVTESELFILVLRTKREIEPLFVTGSCRAGPSRAADWLGQGGGKKGTFGT